MPKEENKDLKSQKIGFLGLGSMGGNMARNLLQEGYDLCGFDPDRDKLEQFRENGGAVRRSPKEVISDCEILLTSLPNSDVHVEVAESDILPNLAEGQIVVALGTVVPGEVRRLAEKVSKRGASLLDVPVSGGVSGAEGGTLRMFAGGSKEAFLTIRPILEVLGNPDRIVYCGENGLGQVTKGVNQLAMGLSSAAYLEALALGVNCEVDPSVLEQGIGGEEGWRKSLRDTAQLLVEGQGEEIGVKHGQLPYFIEEARNRGFELPLTECLWNYLKGAEKIIQEANRESPSFWHELKKETD